MITLPLHKLDFTEGTLTDDLQCAVVLRTLGSSEETQKVGLLLLGGVLLLLLTGIRQFVAQTNAFELLRSVISQYLVGGFFIQQYDIRTFRCASWLSQRSP